MLKKEDKMSKNVKSKNNNDRNKNNIYKWVIIVTIVAFILSIARFLNDSSNITSANSLRLYFLL